MTLPPRYKLLAVACSGVAAPSEHKDDIPCRFDYLVMATEKYEVLVVQSLETISTAMSRISESTRAIQESQRTLNENLLTHQREMKECMALIGTEIATVSEATKGMKQDFKETFYPIFKTVIYALAAIAGGATVLKILGV